MPAENKNDPTTVGKTCFHQGDNNTHPLFRIEPGIPCQDAREQASELMGYVCHMVIKGLMEGDQKLLWASHYLGAMAKALLDDAELGVMSEGS
nr:DUF3077 domain-containing protein [uncultured Pseudomonas sp.]